MNLKNLLFRALNWYSHWQLNLKRKKKKTQLNSQRIRKYILVQNFGFGSIRLIGKQTVNRTITLVQFG